MSAAVAEHILARWRSDAAASWRRPAPRRVRAIRDRLREIYGRPVNEPHGDPVAELVRTILSQNTNDRNRDVAYERLRERFPTWEEVRDAPLERGDRGDPARRAGEHEGARGSRRCCASSATASPTSTGSATPPARRRSTYLTALPGVGRKTAACVMIFAFDRPEIPVDTHVYRVGGRLGLFRERASFEEAHDEMLAIIDPADAYELHINLIRHGRARLPARARAATSASLRRMCPYWRRVRAGSAPSAG